MPLLKKKTLEKTPVPEFMRDNEEVFHCVMTNEIFRDYEEFAERTILCNSMVWTCSLTGKTNLTYEEALQSEEKARNDLKDFPIEIRIPILYLANLTKRTCFTDMADDICAYLKDRYFLGEKIELAKPKGKQSKQYRILKVIPPSDDDIKNGDTNHNNNDKRRFYPPANLYKYEVENLTDKNNEKLVVEAPQMHRQRKIFSDQKVRLFLKQYVEQGSEGFVIIKQSALDLFGINNINYSEISSGPSPSFIHSKDPRPKKVKQQTLAKFLSKNNIITAEEQQELDKKLKEREELKEQKLREKELQKQKHLEIQAKLREWHVPSEDLLLEDHKPLPEFPEIHTKIPDEVFGDALAIIDFLNTFSQVLVLKARFRNGVTLDIMERALASELPEGPLIDILLVLLVAIFKYIEEERKNTPKKFKLSMENGDSDYSLETVRAVQAGSWCLKNYGDRITQLPLDSLTITEVLRLHLLTSGTLVNEMVAKWRVANRGGYTSDEDPAIVFRMQNPQIIKYLEMHNVVLLSVEDKVKILNCLVNQLLTFKELRDVIDKEMEDINNAKNEIKTIQANEKKRIQDFGSQIAQIKKGTAENKLESINELKENNERLKKQAEKTIEGLAKSAMSNNAVLGYDRAFRRYVRVQSTRGVYINQEDLNLGTCLPEIVPNIPELINASDEIITKYLNKITEEMNTSDKENEPKDEKKSNDDKLFTKRTNNDERLLMCSSDSNTCLVHSNINHRWLFIDDADTFEVLIDSLNKRGIRESELLNNLKNNKESLVRAIKNTYDDDYNTEEIPIKHAKHENFGLASGIDTVNALYQVTLDSIIKLEDKLYQGNLGGIENKRHDWIRHVNGRNFGSKHELLRPKHKFYYTLEQQPEDIFLKHKEYKDPALYLEKYLPENDDEPAYYLEQSQFEKKSIQFLACALSQVAYSVNPLCLGAPLGVIKTGNSPNGENNHESQITKDVMFRWDKSLRDSTSFSQLALHISVLDKSILWKKSTFLVKCNTCFKGKDERNMILCDYCNDGYHIYCLKPKLHTVPNGQWFCEKCKQIHEKEKQIVEMREASDDDEEDNVEEEETEEHCHFCGERCVDNDVVNCSECSLVYHIDCLQGWSIRRSLRGNWVCPQCKENEATKSQAAVANGTRRSNRNDRKEDMPLNNVALQELLADVIKHKDAWPFTRPVQKNEVPDYYEIITKPMDFGTIKYKLNMGEYKYDDEFMSDAKLVFENCNTYNNSKDEVYKCGVNVSKYFTKRCKELNLKLHDDLVLDSINGVENGKSSDYDDDDDEPKRKIRRLKTGSSY